MTEIRPGVGDLNRFLEKNCFQQAICAYCTEKIAFKDGVAYNLDGNGEHRCLSRRGYYDCKHCKKPICFAARKPFNADGTPHRCLTQSKLTESERNFRDLLDLP